MHSATCCSGNTPEGHKDSQHNRQKARRKAEANSYEIVVVRQLNKHLGIPLASPTRNCSAVWHRGAAIGLHCGCAVLGQLPGQQLLLCTHQG